MTLAVLEEDKKVANEILGCCHVLTVTKRDEAPDIVMSRGGLRMVKKTRSKARFQFGFRAFITLLMMPLPLYVAFVVGSRYGWMSATLPPLGYLIMANFMRHSKLNTVVMSVTVTNPNQHLTHFHN